MILFICAGLIGMLVVEEPTPVIVEVTQVDESKMKIQGEDFENKKPADSNKNKQRSRSNGRAQKAATRKRRTPNKLN